MKFSECLKELETQKGKEIYPFFVPFKIAQQIKLRFFPHRDFPVSGWEYTTIRGERYLIYVGKMYLRVDRFGQIHAESLQNFSVLKEANN